MQSIRNSPQLLSWDQARQYCEENRSALINIYSETDARRLLHLIVDFVALKNEDTSMIIHVGERSHQTTTEFIEIQRLIPAFIFPQMNDIFLKFSFFLTKKSR
jgi:flagellar biosynthesis protein FliP